MSGPAFWSTVSTKSFGPLFPITKLIFVLGYHTGARLGELRSIKWPQVEEHRIVLNPGTTKNGEGRALPIYGEMAGWIEMAKEAAKSFPKCPYLCQHDGQPLGDSCVKKAWKTACKSVGLPELRFHDLRRSAQKHGPGRCSPHRRYEGVGP